MKATGLKKEDDIIKYREHGGKPEEIEKDPDYIETDDIVVMEESYQNKGYV